MNPEKKTQRSGERWGIAWMHSICIQAQVMEYLENLQSDETQWKNAKNGDLDRLYDAWSEVLTQIDKGKKARVAAASKVRQILEECAAVDTSGRYDNAENWYQC